MYKRYLHLRFLLIVTLILSIFISKKLSAQTAPINDNCIGAIDIPISSGGYALGTFNSDTINMTYATLQPGEYVPPALNSATINHKSIWYKFTIPTNRSVRISIKQPTVLIPAGSAGFAVYKTSACLPTSLEISTKITPLATFGNSYHPCLETGTYYVQVLGSYMAEGPVFIEVELERTNEIYDNMTSAGDLGVLSLGHNVRGFTVGCHNVEQNIELCNNNKFPANQVYNKSVWFTFTTPNYYDVINLVLAKNNTNTAINLNLAGISVYKGNITTSSMSSLIPILECDTLRLNSRNASFRKFNCGELDTNQVYSVKLLFHEEFSAPVRFSVYASGNQPTKSPQPTIAGIHNDNKLGVINNANISKYDFLGCNSTFNPNGTCPIEPNAGININNVIYNLSTYYTFKLNTSQNIRINVNGASSCSPIQLRLFKSNVTNSCNSIDQNTLISSVANSLQINCLDTGEYLVQILGSDVRNVARNYADITTANNFCKQGNLGDSLNVVFQSEAVYNTNRFNLLTLSDYNNINNGLPLTIGNTYNYPADTFGCNHTLRPHDYNICGTYQKSIFRQLNVNDTGVLQLADLNAQVNGSKRVNYVIYRGNASQLSLTQNVNNYPSLLNNLDRVSTCLTSNQTNPTEVCITPGTYTIVALGDSSMVNWVDNSKIQYLNDVRSNSLNPNTPYNLGSIKDSISGNIYTSNIDTFSCRNNAISINNVAPCGSKAIYREFYLNEESLVRIQSLNQNSNLQLFSGRISQGQNGLQVIWTCFKNRVSEQCQKMPVGWYTIVDYGDGATYNTVTANNGVVRQQSQIRIEFIQQCTETPKFNRPYKASYATNNQPYVISWDTAVTNSTTNPNTQKTITLAKENFDCSVDTGAVHRNFFGCNNANKIAFYVIEIKRESFLKINGLTKSASLYSGNIRVDSTLMASSTPIQTCMANTSRIEICNIQPGFYTLVIHANDGDMCTSITPQIIVDKVDNSRFDFAKNAYDFGIIPGNNTYINGKVGDVHPTHTGRAPSSDFFYCTTGAAMTDPTDGSCNNAYNPRVYGLPNTNKVMYTNTDNPIATRRNLWYTFQTNKAGLVTIKVDSRRTGQTNNIFNVAVYKSDVNATLPFSAVVSGNMVDSTLAQGLTLVTSNITNANTCTSTKEFSFNITGCENPNARYYIVVDLPASYILNQQIDVSLKQDSIGNTATQFDFYSTAGDIGTIGTNTLYSGPIDNFSCATRSLVYPNSPNPLPACGTKTIWYKFTVANNASGTLYLKSLLNGAYNASFTNLTTSVYLFKQVIPGDSTVSGLSQLTLSTANISNENWKTTCVTPGTYYILYSGCSRLNENVQPQIRIEPSDGDFCFNALSINMTSVGTASGTVNIDCHSIGSDYGEYNQTLTCPNNALTSSYKSSWFKIDINSRDTLDVTTFISSNITSGGGNIQYRLMTGNCNAMQEQSCITDALTQNTYECMIPGQSYYIQVFSPLNAKGTITLNVNAIARNGNCSPMNNCLKNAYFTYDYDCTVSEYVTFSNNSTFGTYIEYLWDFGYNGQTSTVVNPQFRYPALSTTATYNVTLRVVNTFCSDTAYYSLPVTIGPRPSVNLGNDTVVCGQSSITLNANSFNGVTHLWSDNSTNSTLNVTESGIYSVVLDYNGCTATDSIKVNISSITKNLTQRLVLCSDTSYFVLNSSRNLTNVRYVWNTTDTSASIQINTPGIYYVDVRHDSCIVRDSFIVTRFNDSLSILNNDTLFCNLSGTLTLNATVNGATSYTWNTNQNTPIINVNTSGLYTVIVGFGSCTLRDSINVVISRDTIINRFDTLCAYDTFRMIPNMPITTSGVYRDTLSTIVGCDSIITYNVYFRPTNHTSSIENICIDLVPYSWNNILIDSSGTYTYTSTNRFGCDSTDTLVITIHNSFYDSLNVTLCSNQLPYHFNNRLVNSAGIYRDTFLTSMGCDSIIALNLIVYPSYADTVFDTLCYNQTYTLPNNTVVAQTGVYIDTFTTVNNCDSIIVTNLWVHPNRSASINQSICANQTPYAWNGQSLINTGTYTYTTLDINGCDSTTTLSLIVNDNFNQIINDTICNTVLPYIFNNRNITATGTYIDSFMSQSGCDSIITLNLLVNQSFVDTIIDTICFNEQYVLPSLRNVNTTGTYIDSFINSVGCDSVIVTQLLVNPNRSDSIQLAICSDQVPYSWNGQSLNTSGTYYHIANDVNGCDSTTVLSLTINNTISQVINDTICSNQLPYVFNSRNITATGTYIDSFVTISGCDSIITLNLVVNQSFTDTITDTICYNEQYVLPSLRTVNVTGTYIDTFTNAVGCDSIIVTHLLVNPNRSATTSITICSSQLPYSWNGQTLNAAGVFTYTTNDINGCDSITALTFNVNDVYVVTFNDSVCDNTLPYIFNNRSINSPGTYIDTFQSVQGCDSISILNLVIYPTYRDTIFDTICHNQTYTLPSNVVVNTSGFYTSNLSTVNNCDSIVVTNLFVKPNRSLVIYDTTCNNQTPYFWNGQSINTTGSYTYTTNDINGCDSTTTLQLVVHPNITTTLTENVCSNNLPFVFNGNNIYLPGIYYDTLVDQKGCDSFIVLNFNVLTSTRDTITVERCYGESYFFVDTLLNTSGVYTKVLTNIAGCDSVLVLNLTIHNQTPLPIVVSPVGYCEGVTAIPLLAQGVNLKWYTVPTGGTSTTIAPTPNTNITGNTKYYVTQTLNGCESDRAVIDVYVSEKPAIKIEAPESVCSIDSALVKIQSGYDPNHIYYWNFDGGQSTALGNEEYKVKWNMYGYKNIWLVAEEYGCFSDTVRRTILVKETPRTPSFNVQDVVCQGDIIVAIAPPIFNGSYEWTVNGQLYGSGDTIRIPTNNRTGNFTIKLQAHKDECYSEPVEKVVFVSELPDASIITDETIVCFNDTFYVEAKVKNPNYTYLWESENGFLDNTESSMELKAIMRYSAAVYLTVTNEFNCSVTDSLLLPTQHCCDLWVPNAFSPNGDGLNDEFRIYAKTNQKLKDFSVYDRYGKRVFYSINQNVFWDGTVDGKPASRAVYFYIIQYTCSDDQEYTLRGDITILD